MDFLIITALRLLVPLSIFRWPLFGVLASAFVDLQDYYYLSRSNFDMGNYQNWDKLLDTYYLGIAAFTCLAWKEPLAKKIILFAFGWRFIGVLLEELTGNRGFLFFFPNFFESFFIFYLIFKLFRPKQDLLVNPKITAIVIAALLLPKLLQEYSMHLIQTPPTYIFDLSKVPAIGYYFPRPPEDLAQVGFFFALPVIVLIWRLWETGEKIS